jgi:pimeloyl-ACP methyl ester carboxylesterase
VVNAGIRLAYLAVGERGRPLVVCPGLSDSAEDYREILQALAPQHTVALSFRGQAGSDTPGTGYDLQDFASDIGAILDAFDLQEVVLFAHSRAVAYAIAYTALHPGRVAKLVLGDAAPVHRSYPPAWVDGFAASQWRGQRVDQRIPRQVLHKVQREARHVDLWDTLVQLPVPTVALIGGAHPAQYLTGLTSDYQTAGVEVIVIDGATHDLWNPDLDRFVTLLRDLADPDSGTHTGQ